MGNSKKISVNTILNTIILFVYSAIVIVGALRHEIWFDEVQSWLISKENTVPEIFALLKYEGHPPLWYMIMRALSLLDFPVGYLPLISASVSIISVWLILRYAPFNTLVKCSMVFYGGFLYFNSVMARPYCLIQLFLVLIAIMYKKRNEHPIIFGTLVALLANTHVMMCGLVGILGIYMIYELILHIREVGFAKSRGHIIGLAIAGAGVLMLVLPIMTSLVSNRYMNDSIKPLGKLFDSIFIGTSSAFENILSYTFGNISYLIAPAMSIILIIAFVLMRHYRRSFSIAAVYAVMCLIVCNHIWFFMGNRSCIYIFTFIILLWIAKENETPVYRQYKPTNSKLISSLIKADLNAPQLCEILLAVSLLSTVPSAAVYLVRDFNSYFSAGEAVAQYINDNLEEDAVFLTYTPEYADVAVYAPQVRYYSIPDCSYYTYMTTKQPEPFSYDKIYSDLSKEKHVYAIVTSSFLVMNKEDLLFSVENAVEYHLKPEAYYIVKFDIEQLPKYIDMLKEYYE